MRSLLIRLLRGRDGRLSSWSLEFITELDAECARSGQRSAHLWYLRRLLEPATIRFILLNRRRARITSHRTATIMNRTFLLWDVRQALRGLLREPRFVSFMVLTLALGIGANAAMFGVADRLFLQGPAHVRNPGELVRLYLHFERTPQQDPRTQPWIPWTVTRNLMESATAFSSVASYRVWDDLIQIDGETRSLSLSTVSGSWFHTLGTTPSLGRLITDDDVSSGERVAVISQALWRAEWDGAPDAIGSAITLPQGTFTVVGVAPAGFTGPDLGGVDVWVPIDLSTARFRNWEVIARLAPGLTGEAGMVTASADANGVHQRTSDTAPSWSRNAGVIAAPIGYDDAGREPAEALVSRLLLAVVGLVLLIACANVVSMLLARMTARRRELAVRLALGAGRLRLMRLLLAESVILALLGAIVSLPLAWFTGNLLRRTLLPDVAWISSVLDLRVLIVTTAVALGTGVLVGILPAIQATRHDLATGLRAGDRGGHSRRRARLHMAMAAAQTALATALLVSAGLFLRSFWVLRATDLGVEPARALMASLRAFAPAAMPSQSDAERSVYLAALEAARNHPRVATAALSVGLPFIYNFSTGVEVPGLDSIPALPGGGPYLSTVTEDYFDAVGTPIVRGTAFTREQVQGREAVVVVSQQMAQLLWPGQDAIGQCVTLGITDHNGCYRVIGVAGDVHRVGYREPPSMQFYIPLGQEAGFGGMALVVRPRGNSLPAEQLRALLRASHPLIDHVEIRTLQSLLDPQTRPWQLGATVLTVSAALALLVSVAGVYGVLSYLVAQRRREIGVRMALGATRGGIQSLVLRTGATPAVLGLLLGTVIVFAARRWLEPLLFETSARDPLVFATAGCTLVVAAVMACVVPARRASRVEPVVCLKDV